MGNSSVYRRYFNSRNLINFNAVKTQYCLISRRKEKSFSDTLWIDHPEDKLPMIESTNFHCGEIWSKEARLPV